MSQYIDPKHWGRIRLPDELIDATRAIARREGLEPSEQLHLFWYMVLKKAYPELTALAKDLHGLDWLDHLVNERNNT